ncbi:hypothetical protein KIN20_015665 [Parelaphostrongylus tenuis]|uniref:Sushi domain-containing protein n=1 Tax=Parelaphostrongylus tenuis TaxID=148309 RepID=A0AAD5MGE4_PARTN|nr:hypothetical protein KIN20_015665 [Parelaphostrongylus tenuis]
MFNISVLMFLQFLALFVGFVEAGGWFGECSPHPVKGAFSVEPSTGVTNGRTVYIKCVLPMVDFRLEPTIVTHKVQCINGKYEPDIFSC